MFPAPLSPAARSGPVTQFYQLNEEQAKLQNISVWFFIFFHFHWGTGMEIAWLRDPFISPYDNFITSLPES